jgi:hypothetical protein
MIEFFFIKLILTIKKKKIEKIEKNIYFIFFGRN